MKKTLLYLSLIFTISYSALYLAVLLLQTLLVPLLGATSMEPVTVFPAADVIGMILSAGIAVLCFFLLSSSVSREGTGMELISLVLLSAVFLLSPYVSYVGSAVQNLVFSASGAPALVSLALVHNLLSFLQPLMECSMLLLIVFSAFSMGRKKYESR